MVIILFFLGCTTSERQENEYLVEVDYLKSRLDGRNIRIIDMRKETDFLNGHIPGATHISRSDFDNPDFSYGGMMPNKDQLQKLLREKGVNTEDELIVYDDKAGCEAARLWFILRTFHFDNVKILNGGFDEWQRASLTTSTKEREYHNGNFTFKETLSRKWVASHEDIKPQVVVIDCRTHDEFTGKRHKTGAASAGRIPGSIRIDWSSCVNWEGDKRFKNIVELKKIYAEKSISKDTPVIVYCHSGVRSSHTFFVLKELLGFTDVKNYDGSWTEWSHFTHLPIEKDSVTIYFD